jgi:hypothetical protein
VQAVGWFEAQQRGLFAEEDGWQLRVAVFECEVDVARWRGTQVRDFAFDPEVAVFPFNVEADFTDEVADLPDVAGDRRWGRLKRQAKLVVGLLPRAGRRVHNC